MFALPLEGLALSVTRKRQGQAEWIAQFTYFRKWRFDIQMAFAVSPNWPKMPPLMGSHGSVPCVFFISVCHQEWGSKQCWQACCFYLPARWLWVPDSDLKPSAVQHVIGSPTKGAERASKAGSKYSTHSGHSNFKPVSNYCAQAVS